jgi:RNA-directed DNA polymerase
MALRENGQTSIGSFFTREFGETTKKAKQMTTETSKTVGAASHGKVSWHAIDWQKAHENVRRLQVRIVKATQEGRWGKVKALQRLLTHSYSAKVIAVKRVTENQGKWTPGVDGEIWDTPDKKARAIMKLQQRNYHPLPLRRIYIPKSDGKRQRPLGIPAMVDRAMQALYLQALDPIAETTADPNSYGFRMERSTADAIEQCHTVLSVKGGAQWILEGDIRACFDQISHEWLLTHIPMDKVILRKWLKAGYMEKNVFHPTEAGTPQGAICSPVLANLTLDGLEKEIRIRYPKATTRSGKAKVNLVRFADDFVITGSTKELLETEIQPLVEQFMQERGLELSPEKTRITHISDGFDFLGQHIGKYGGKILTRPSRKNTMKFLSKVRTIIKSNKQAIAGNLILQLNPVIRGWTNYHRHGSSKRTFSTMDHAIFQSLWQWAKRRHPKKSKRWIKEKYFKTVGERNWVFQGQIEGKDGHSRTVRLYNAASVPIQRHTKIKGEANPYDPLWETYFEERLDMKMASNLHERRKLLYLWKEQNGVSVRSANRKSLSSQDGITITLSGGQKAAEITHKTEYYSIRIATTKSISKD